MSVNNALSYFAGTTITSNASTTQGGIGLSPGDNGHPTILKGPKTGNTSGQTFLYLPNSPGTNGQVLSTNGPPGVLSWASSAIVGGSDTEFQYNSSGSLAGLSTFTTDGTDLTITLDNQLNFRDAQLFINSSSDGQLDINADGTLQLTAPTVDIDASTEVNVSGAMKVGGTLTLGSKQNEFEISETTDDITIKNTVIDKDIIFNINDNSVDTEVMRLDGSEGSLLIASAQKIQFRDTDLYINSSSDGALELASDELIYIKSHDTNLIGSNASIDIKGAVMLGDLRGVTDSNTMVAMVPQTFWVIDASTSNGLVVSSNTNIYIDLQDNTGSNEHAVEVQGSNATGQLLNLMFNNEGTNTVKLDFGINLLVSGSGLARYLTFVNTGESASLVYIGNKWRIMNTGATVS